MQNRSLRMTFAAGCLVWFCIYATGCLCIRMTESMLQVDQDRFFPKRTKFTITPNQPPKASRLSYDSIYVWKRVWEYESRWHTNYFHFRFWPTGECIRFVDTTDPMLTFVGDSFHGGDMGFYKTDGSRIAIEIYVPDSYNRYYGSVYSNEVHISQVDLQYAAAKRAYSSNEDLHFIRHHIGNMVRPPDWSPTGMLKIAGSPLTNQ